jgi:aryl-alcohol dehydrogenase-like predicted oxidoreductase
MEQRHVGRSGLVVSRLALGTMSWGRETVEDDAAEQFRLFLGAGGTTLDTADSYADGESERILGRLLADTGTRNEVVLATKAVSPAWPGAKGRGASRGHLLAALDASLERLSTSHVDLWQLHAFDPNVPLEETLSALDTAVESGRARYVGISNYTGWQTAAAAAWQRAWPGRAPLVSTQVEWSLLARGVEREVVPAAEWAGLGLLPWSPLGRGVLTGKYRNGTPADSRGASAHWGGFVSPYLGEAATHVVDAVVTAADGLGVTPLAVALAWVRDNPGVAAPVVGARTTGQLRGVLASEELTLPMSIRAALDDVSAPVFDYPQTARTVSSLDS